MIKRINAEDLSNKQIDYTIDIKTPGKCPRCGNGVNAEVMGAYVLCDPDENQGESTVTYFCPNCEKIFLGEYFGPCQKYQINRMELRRLFPKGEDCTHFSDKIKELSPKFVKIYNQAEVGEQEGFIEIVGTGYRKALEFLVKDYACKFNEDDTEKIEKMSLSQCIDKYIDNKKVKELAKVSSWLGNDQTHYVNKHEEYGIDKIKAFIFATVSFVESDLYYLNAKEITENNM